MKTFQDVCKNSGHFRTVATTYLFLGRDSDSHYDINTSIRHWVNHFFVDTKIICFWQPNKMSFQQVRFARQRHHEISSVITENITDNIAWYWYKWINRPLQWVKSVKRQIWGSVNWRKVNNTRHLTSLSRYRIERRVTNFLHGPSSRGKNFSKFQI